VLATISCPHSYPLSPGLAPIGRLIAYLAEHGTIRKVPTRALFFLIAHGAAAPFSQLAVG
jgi:hypothetical protein